MELFCLSSDITPKPNLPFDFIGSLWNVFDEIL